MRLDAASCRNELTHALTPQYGCSPQNAAAHGQPGALPYADAGSASNALAKLQRIQMRFCVTAANKSTNPLSASAFVSWRFGARSLPRRRFRHTWPRASWPQPTTSAQCSGPTRRSGFKVRGPAVGAVGDPRAGPRQTLLRWVGPPASSDGSRCQTRSPAAPRLFD